MSTTIQTVTEPAHDVDHAEMRLGKERDGAHAGRELFRMICTCGFAGASYTTTNQAVEAWVRHASEPLDLPSRKARVSISRKDALLLSAGYL